MHRTAILFFRTTTPRRMPEQVREKVHAKIAEFPVNPNGLLQLRVSDCSPHITCLDFGKHPNNDHVVVQHCEGCRVTTLDDADFHHSTTKPKIKDSKVLSLSCSNSQHDMFCGCTVRVPAQMALDISAQGDADVKISGLEPRTCHISADYGLVSLDRIKTTRADIFASNGSIEIKGAFHGNLTIKAGMEGFVRADRIQGSSVQIDTFQGPIDCKAVYGEKVQVSSRKGGIAVRNLQAEAVKIWSTEGNVEIGSVEGNLTANLGRGSLKATISKTDGVHVKAIDGNISIGLPESLQANLILDGKDVRTSDLAVDFDKGHTGKKITGKLNGGSSDCELEISSKSGKIDLHQTDWMSTLNLGGRSDEDEEKSTRSRGKISLVQ